MNQLLPREPLLAKNEAGFWIPEEPGSTGGNGIVAMIGAWLLRHSDQLAEPRSWPWTLLREAVLVAQRQNRYTDQVLTELYESSETGPLGCLATATLLDQVQSPGARRFAARGLERLSAEDFRRDCRALLGGHSLPSQCFQNLAAALRGLNDEQLAALAQGHSPARAEFIQDCARRLREAKGQPEFEAIAPALDAYWQRELKEQVAAALRGKAVDPVAAYEKALSLYEAQDMSRDYAQAAKLFQQAAEANHPAAQYCLAVLYEKGQGVSKDSEAALKWYRASGMNGCVDAAMALGNLYNDGLAVEPNLLEAFVWYSVAAAHGHKVAPVLRDGLRRRLPAAQVAEGQKQLAEILAHKRPGSSSPAKDE